MSAFKLQFVLATAAAVTLTLAACSTIPTFGESRAARNASDSIVAGVCEAFPAITYSTRDTTLTRCQVQRHNRAYTALCNPGAPLPPLSPECQDE